MTGVGGSRAAISRSVRMCSGLCPGGRSVMAGAIDPWGQVLPTPAGADPSALAAQAAASAVTVGGPLTGVSPPPAFHPIPGGAFPLPQVQTSPSAAVGAAVGHAITGQTPPAWLQGLVSQYRQSPSQHMWRHLMLGEGVGSQYA